MALPRYPNLYEINTRHWLRELGKPQGKPLQLDEVPDSAIEELAADGFDWVWLLGVWQSGMASQRVARIHPQMQKQMQEVLPDLSAEDIQGSPFAVRRYQVHPELGGNAALATLRERLRARGIRLVLDFVPNHCALDHPWIDEHPEFFLHGDDWKLVHDPENWCQVESSKGKLVLAHGRDPNYPGWPDTLQLNYRHAGLRTAMLLELEAIARHCDGVRCEMAMLVLPQEFARTWGDAALPVDGTLPVDAPFWNDAIAHVRHHHPDFLFIAEVYWDREWVLQQQGFDYTYDKRLYDRLWMQDAGSVRGHLWADLAFQNRSVRFLENHDEPRAASAFPMRVHQAAATIAYLVPGMRFFHDGQLTGTRVRAPVQLSRWPEETVDSTLHEFYQKLLACLRRPEVRTGRWQLLACRPAWDGNTDYERFLAFLWEDQWERRLLVTVNYGGTRGQCYVGLPLTSLHRGKVLLRDQMSPAVYERDGDELGARGLFLDVPEWGIHVFELTNP